MPMRRGQRVRPVLFGDEALTALERLAGRNANLSEVINDLGPCCTGPRRCGPQGPDDDL